MGMPLLPKNDAPYFSAPMPSPMDSRAYAMGDSPSGEPGNG
jgi:hypothetical protein